MAKDRSTPEEELLSLIQEGDEGFSQPKQQKKKAKFSLAGKIKKAKRLFPFLYEAAKKKLIELKEGTGETSLKPTIKVLAIIAVILFIYSVADFALGRPDISRIKERLAVDTDRYTIADDAEEEKIAIYRAALDRRDIFAPFIVERDPEPDRGLEAVREEAQRLASGLDLVGIMLSPRPQAMIEDKNQGRTFFLEEGDTIGDFTIKEILSDKVILDYKGEKIEL